MSEALLVFDLGRFPRLSGYPRSVDYFKKISVITGKPLPPEGFLRQLVAVYNHSYNQLRTSFHSLFYPNVIRQTEM